MTRRSKAREVILQLLFQRDANAEVERKVIERFAKDRLREPPLITFSLGVYDGVLKNQEMLDQHIKRAAENWSLTRIAPVDRNVLRIGAYELMFTPETPANVAFDEAIELARRFGSADSPRFVNGVLDRIRQLAATPA